MAASLPAFSGGGRGERSGFRWRVGVINFALIGVRALLAFGRFLGVPLGRSILETLFIRFAYRIGLLVVAESVSEPVEGDKSRVSQPSKRVRELPLWEMVPWPHRCRRSLKLSNSSLNLSKKCTYEENDKTEHISKTSDMHVNLINNVSKIDLPMGYPRNHIERQ